ncbi:hypothetical protein GALMADRAFT_253875 [Galerina marginata CBS 339.88]|uniref:C3H1-type domain-containing protein n=1 Tax=Galerina marginata (strain CBS 339.88) TaxID=685588 RepID=A0A067SKX7_GALM3|nr:hypothetical protein GALMADRAFT_253875 [Galerina marginata CBS 339.88]
MSVIPENKPNTAEAEKVEHQVSAETIAEPIGAGTTDVPQNTAQSAKSSPEAKEKSGKLSIEDEILNGPSTSSVTVVLSPPKSTEELIAARAEKRAARKAAVREQADAHKRAGDILFESRNYKGAYPQYLEAIRLWGSNPTYFISLAGAYRKLQWYEEAAHAATRALTLDPKNSEARYVRGVARLEQRLLKPAKTDFETVVEHDPSHLLARAALTEVTHFIATSTQLGSHELSPNPVDDVVKDVDFGFPHHDYEALEVAELSDSSDCTHVGNGVQCRFYNHDGCGRGTACTFSHAPDEKSIRDELGKNVCMYFLMDSCKFGVEKCIYSHSKAALPKRGWWTSAEQVAKVKSVLEVAEKKNREQRQQETALWKAHVKALKAAGRPPKSAGVKGPGKKGEKLEKKDGVAPAAEEAAGEAAKATDQVKETVNGDDEPPKSAGVEKNAQKKKEGAKPNGNRHKSQSSAARKKKAAASPAKAAPEASTDTVPPAPLPASEGKAAVSAGFTDYHLNAPPTDTKPEAPVTLSY